MLGKTTSPICALRCYRHFDQSKDVGGSPQATVHLSAQSPEESRWCLDSLRNSGLLIFALEHGTSPINICRFVFPGTQRCLSHHTSWILCAGIVYDCDLRVGDVVAFFFLLTPVNTEFFHVVQIGIPNIVGAQSYGEWLGISASTVEWLRAFWNTRVGPVSAIPNVRVNVNYEPFMSIDYIVNQVQYDSVRQQFSLEKLL